MEKQFKINRRSFALHWLITTITVVWFFRISFLLGYCLLGFKDSTDATLKFSEDIFAASIYWLFFPITGMLCISTSILTFFLIKKLVLPPIFRCLQIVISERTITLISFSGKTLLQITGHFEIRPYRKGLKISWNDLGKDETILLDKGLFDKRTFVEIEKTLMLIGNSQ